MSTTNINITNVNGAKHINGKTADIDGNLTLVTADVLTAQEVIDLASITDKIDTVDAEILANTAESNAKTYADGLVVGLWDDRGAYDASTSIYPSNGGSGVAGAILKGDLWTISVAGTIGDKVLEVGDVLRAVVNSPGSTNSNWAVVQNNIGYVAENVSNKVTDITGNETSTTKYASIKAIIDWFSSSKLFSILGITATNTEINYLSGIASNVQNQLNNKANLNTLITPATATKVTYDAKGMILSGTNITTSDVSGLGTLATQSTIPVVIQLACSDETTALTTGNSKVTFRMPHAMTLTAVRASLNVAGTTSGITTIDINEGGVSVLSTKLTIDLTEKTSTTAATPAVISDSSLADDAEITIDIDAISGGATEKGLKISLIGTRAV